MSEPSFQNTEDGPEMNFLSIAFKSSETQAQRRIRKKGLRKLEIIIKI